MSNDNMQEVTELSVPLQRLYLALEKGVVKVTFNKVNGDQRVMDSTLNPAVLAEHGYDTPPEKRTTQSDAIAVFDVNAKGWRSFKWSKVVELDC